MNKTSDEILQEAIICGQQELEYLNLKSELNSPKSPTSPHSSKFTLEKMIEDMMEKKSKRGFSFKFGDNTTNSLTKKSQKTSLMKSSSEPKKSLVRKMSTWNLKARVKNVSSLYKGVKNVFSTTDLLTKKPPQSPKKKVSSFNLLNQMTNSQIQKREIKSSQFKTRNEAPSIPFSKSKKRYIVSQNLKKRPMSGFHHRPRPRAIIDTTKPSTKITSKDLSKNSPLIKDSSVNRIGKNPKTPKEDHLRLWSLWSQCRSIKSSQKSNLSSKIKISRGSKRSVKSRPKSCKPTREKKFEKLKFNLQKPSKRTESILKNLTCVIQSASEVKISGYQSQTFLLDKGIAKWEQELDKCRDEDEEEKRNIEILMQ